MNYEIKMDNFDIINSKNIDFSYLLDYNLEYYDIQLNEINSNLINNFSKALLNKFHLEYYIKFNKLIKESNENRQDLDYFNMSILDNFFENIENNLSISNNKNLVILNSILDISSVFLDNAIDESSFESLFDSFFQLKDRLESNNFLNNYMIFNVKKIKVHFSEFERRVIKYES